MGFPEHTMLVVNRWKNLTALERGSAVALGNFDGVHLGHQGVIANAAAAAAGADAKLGVVSFAPHARAFFQPDAPPFRLMTPPQLARTLGAMGVECLYTLTFDAEMAGFSDREFVKDVLVDGLGVRHVAIGFDVTFGRGRTGDPQSMQRYGQQYGFTVSVSPPATLEGQKISSSAIRAAVQAGDVGRAARLLGRPFAIEGAVERGRRIGRTLGFPTANVSLGAYVVPRFGVYATRTRLSDGRIVNGVSNIGVNPTTGEVAARLEVWLFDFNEDIYDEIIETELLAFLREEHKFSSVEDMVLQIREDAVQARLIHAASRD